MSSVIAPDDYVCAYRAFALNIFQDWVHEEMLERIVAFGCSTTFNMIATEASGHLFAYGSGPLVRQPGRCYKRASRSSVVRELSDSVGRTGVKFLADYADQKERVAENVATPHSAWLLAKPPDPLEAGFAHPHWRAWNAPGVEVEQATHTCRNRHLKASAMVL